MLATSGRDRSFPAHGTANALPVLLLRLTPNPLHHGAVGIVRSLGRLGVRVHAVCEGAWSPVARSRHCAGRLPLPLAGTPAAEIVDSLLRWAGRLDERPLLLPIDDPGAVFVDDHAEALARSFRFPRQPPGLVRRLSNKVELSRLCAEHGIPTPKIAVPQDDGDLQGIAEQMRYPLVLKRATEWTPGEQREPRMAVARTREEVFVRFAQMRGPDEPNVLVQEYVPGGPDSVWMFNGYFDAESRCRFAATGRKLRQYPVGTGPTTLGECRDNERVRTLTVSLLERCGYRGIVDLGFRHDARDGEYKLLDVNPRIGSTFRLFTDPNGLDVARALYLDLAGERFKAARPRDGRRWLVENYDLLASVRYRQVDGLTVRAWARSLAGVEELAWAAVDDPLPAALMLLRSGAAGARRIATRRRAR